MVTFIRSRFSTTDFIHVRSRINQAILKSPLSKGEALRAGTNSKLAEPPSEHTTEISTEAWRVKRNRVVATK